MTFGIDADGNYGYIKAGADTVIPFSKSTLEFELMEGPCKPGDVIDLKKQIVAIAIAYDRKSMFASTTFRVLSLGNLYRYPDSNKVILDGTKATLTYSGGTAAGGGSGDTDPADYYMALVVK